MEIGDRPGHPEEPVEAAGRHAEPIAVRSWSGLILLALSLAIYPATTRPQVRSPIPGAKPSVPATSAVVKIRCEDGLVTAQLKDAPLPRVLEELAARTGVIFEIGVHVVSPVTLGLYRVSLQEAIERIVGANNAILYYEKDSSGASRVTFVRILARVNRPAQPSLRYIGTGTITKTGDDQIETQEQTLKVLLEKGTVEARQKAIDVMVAAKGEVAVQALSTVLADDAPEMGRRHRGPGGAAALKLQTAMETENLAETGYPSLHMGIGLHAGEVVVGNIGSESRAKYGIIGSAVNLTHRIQGQAQGGEVVVSEMVFHHCEETLAVSRTFETPLKGIAHPVTLYVVESIGGEA